MVAANGTKKNNGRRTQEERSNATRTRLLKATFDCLVEQGYGRTSTPEILKRCGVSRGAMLHHYPTRDDLIAGSVDYVLQRQLAEFRAMFEELPPDVDRAAEVVELLWRSISGPTYSAWLELVVASRNDEALQAKVREVAGRFGDEVRRIYTELFPRTGDMEDVWEMAPQFTFATLTGMALVNIYEDPKRIRRGVDGLKQLASYVDYLYRGHLGE